MVNAKVDTLFSAETPEGILLELRPAGPASRCHAFLLDLLIRLMTMFVLTSVVGALGGMGGLGAALLLITAFLLEWFYPVVFELSRGGATPGKRVMGLTVIMDNGLPITPAASFTRNLLRIADFLPALYTFGLISMLVRQDFKRLGDIAAGTLVVHRALPPLRIQLEGVPPIAPAIALTLREQAAIMALGVRAPKLTAERVDELAALAAEVSGDAGQDGQRVTRRVLGVAQYLLGRR